MKTHAYMLLVLLWFLVSSFLLGSLPAARATSDILIFSIPSAGSTSIGLESSYISNTSSPAAAGQNFPMPAEYKGYSLTKCTWRLARQGTPNGTIVAMFFQTNGTYDINARPLGYVPLAESDPIEMDTMGGSDYLINFTFPSKPLMTDDYYWILIAIKSNTTRLKASEGQYIAVYERPSEVMIGDKCYNQASRWYVYDGNLIVYVYGIPPSTGIDEAISGIIALGALIPLLVFLVVVKEIEGKPHPILEYIIPVLAVIILIIIAILVLSLY